MTATELRPRRDPSRATGPRASPALAVRARRARFWVAIGAAVLAAVVIALIVLGSGATGGAALGPDNAEQGGAKAVVQVLRQQGIRVVTTSTLAQTRKAAAVAPDDTTVFVYDASGYLVRSTWKQVAGFGSHTIVANADQTALDVLAPGTQAGAADLKGTLSPSCDLPALAASPKVNGSGVRYTSTTPGAVKCLPAASGGGYGLVQVSRASHLTTVVGTTTALTNASVADDDDSAFALRLLGDSPTLVWYLPSVTDLPAGTGTLASLTPGWVTPSIVLLAAAALAGAVWRGRRLGPLVVENLPVVVRSTETMEGRARLYERNSARMHALDQVRIGTLGRLASQLGLSRNASVDDVVLRSAALLGEDPRRLRSLLVDTEPTDDRMLVSLSDGLRDLERAVARMVRDR
ncbi:DUF4350 domain-containing protein [Frondihabitans cladoniiphilus]|uniref:DUF4350 domain-containing protein n=1 Tax=Frondihabitans cladoniiphilus TaxID=715785 RepID=A0ABP8WDY6_9MICO